MTRWGGEAQCGAGEAQTHRIPGEAVGRSLQGAPPPPPHHWPTFLGSISAAPNGRRSDTHANSEPTMKGPQ
jgi:hypothetical protein